MVHDRSVLPDDGGDAELQPAPTHVGGAQPSPRGPFTLASLLDLDEHELAEPMPRIAPAEHRWEQLTLGVAPEVDGALPLGLRSGDSIQLQGGEHDLIPGLDVPGAVEVPVYLAGRALQDLLRSAPPVIHPGERTDAVLPSPDAGTARQPMWRVMREAMHHVMRLLGPVGLIVAALLVFAVVSMVASLRPRPDRSLAIGNGRTTEVTSGVIERAAAEPGGQESFAVVSDVAAALDFLPVFWFPLTTLLVLGAVAGLRARQGLRSDAAVTFTAQTMAWFTLWWALGVPALLMVLRLGFEFVIDAQGVKQVSYLADGTLAGASAGWTAARAVVTTPAFHSALLTAGVLPWVVLAWQRLFQSGTARAIAAGVVVTAIPLLMLAPFA
jgi:hypothetical protein